MINASHLTPAAVVVTTKELYPFLRPLRAAVGDPAPPTPVRLVGFSRASVVPPIFILQTAISSRLWCGTSMVVPTCSSTLVVIEGFRMGGMATTSTTR